MEHYDRAYESGYTVVRIESSNRYKIVDYGPLQSESSFDVSLFKKIKVANIQWINTDNFSKLTLSTRRTNRKQFASLGSQN